MLVKNSTSSEVQVFYRKKTDASTRYALKEIKASILAPCVRAVYLYGSCARNERRQGSDVDLFVEFSGDVVLKFGEEKWRQSVLLLKTSVSPPDPCLPEVDLHFTVGSQWKTDNGTYYTTIRKEGVNIWEES